MKAGYFYQLVNQSQVWIALDLSVRTAWRLLQSKTPYRFAGMGGGSPSPRTGLGLRYKTFTRSGVYKILTSASPVTRWPFSEKKKSIDSIIEKILNMHSEVNNNCIYLTYFRGVLKDSRTFFFYQAQTTPQKNTFGWHGKGKEVFTLTIHIFTFMIPFFNRWSYVKGVYQKCL